MALISKEELEEMYWGEPGTELSGPSIAKILGCSPGNIYYYMNKYGIPKRPPPKVNGDCFVKNTKKKMSNQQKNRFLNKCNHPFYGKNHTKETIDKIKKANADISKETGEKIFNLYFDSKISQKQLANKFNLSKSVVSKMVKCKHRTTKHLKNKFNKEKFISKINKVNKKENNPNSILDKKKAIEIYQKYKENNISYKKLAKEYNLARCTIGRIVRHEHWTTKHLSDKINK